MTTTTIVGGYRVRDIPVALNHAGNDMRRGNFPAALEKYRRAASGLQTIPEEEIEDASAHLEHLQEAQYGVAVTLLYMGDVWQAREVAAAAVDSSFKDVRLGSDPRRYVLTFLSRAGSPRDFSSVWEHLLRLKLAANPMT